MSRLRTDHPALSEGRTIFVKSIKAPADVKRLLQPASTNTKLGGGETHIRKGRWKGMPLYQLVLEERATCPKSCQQWSNCYGNNMYMANRIDHKDPWFYPFLESELDELARKHPDGFVVRLHVLGDFFSKEYVFFWRRLVIKYPQLRIFGYTHRYPEHGDGIGKAIELFNQTDQRVWIRFSDRGGEMSANVGGEGIRCPYETGKTKSCATCGLCWQTTKPIMFTEH